MIPNPWDAGSARVLAGLGFKALASTSSGFAFTLGRLDGHVTLDEVVEHTRVLDEATDLPVSVDLENGYGPDPESVALAITKIAETGAVGGSIEDYDPGGHLYDLEHAAARVAAAAEAARRLEFPFTLTARAENHIRGHPDLDDTIARLRAFEAAGADVLYARSAEAGGDPCRLRGNHEAGERARAARDAVVRDHERRSATGERGGRSRVGRGQRDGRRRSRDSRSRRLLAAQHEPAAS